ncbi:YhgE/Pip family protein [Microlunatus sp. Y2014]|uniref:YhgE/Pip domain-containing protein n=1 Tax=Microlunatus sp. Y2014 TaxID=3418488 RepID=UPI003DA787C5
MSKTTTRSWTTVLGVLLIPLLLAGGFAAALWNAADRTDNVKAAIVNNDEPVTIGEQYVPLGRQLAGKLASGAGTDDTEANYDWVVTDAEDASDGIRTGKYVAVVTIPENFSAAATSNAGEAGEAEQALVDVQVSAAAAGIDPMFSQRIVGAAVDSLNTDLTETYLSNVYVGFNTMGEQFKTVADASGKLADGTGELSTGMGEVAKGTTELNTGMAELSKNGSTLASGVTEYTGGVTSLADGLAQLQSGTAELPSQTRQLANGMNASATGAEQLAGGAKELSGGVGEFAAGVKQTGQGAGELASGAEQLAGGAAQAGGGLEQLSTGAAGLNQGLQQYQSNLQDPIVAAGICQQAGITDPVELKGCVTGLYAAGAGLETPDPQSGVSLLGLAGQLATGVAETSAGINGEGGLVAGTKELAAGARALADGVNGNGTAAEPGLVGGAEQLAGGAAELATGATELAAGNRQLASGVGQLADGMPALSEGIGQAAAGAQQLSAAGPELSAGVTAYTDGVSQVATGTAELSEGMNQLATGSQELNSGARQLADGLAKGATSVPTYSEAEREQLSTVATRPVATPTDDGRSPFTDPALLSTLVAIALWAGGLLSVLALGTGTAGAWRSTASSMQLTLRALAPGAAIATVQGVVLGVAAGRLLDLSAGDSAAVVGVSVLAGLAFLAVNHGLATVAGNVGRFIAVALGILGAAASLMAALPAFLAAVRPALPTTPAMTALTAITGPTDGLGWAVAGLIAWLGVGLVAGWLGMSRKRQVVVRA